MKYVVDTNVAVVANGRDTHASLECQLACVLALKRVVERGIAVLDRGELIFSEYKNHLNFSGEPSVGDYFFREIFLNMHNPDRCLLVDITPEGNSFREFPEDDRLSSFDFDDRKFVAVVVADNYAPRVLNAVDTRSWPAYRLILSELGIIVCELCP